jgi:transposase
MNPETLRKWLRQAEVDPGERGGPLPRRRGRSGSSSAATRELEQTIEILKAATSFFVRESDPRLR